jgi:hypothetical protein
VTSVWRRLRKLKTNLAGLAAEPLGPDARFVASAWLAAPLCRASLRVFGLRPTVRAIERLTASPGGHPPTTSRSSTGRFPTRSATELVDLAWRLGLWPNEGECLPRALVEYGLQRRAGARVRLVIGVQKGEHFGAHAWVEPGAGATGFHAIYATGDA